jgi:uncharacterized protein
MGGVHLDLDGLGLRGGQRHESAYTIGLSPVSRGGVDYQVLLPQGLLVSVERVAGGFLVRLTGEAKAYGPCARCLADTEVDLRAEQEEFAPTAVGGWAESQTSPFIEDLMVDISALTREAVVLAMPELVLCALDCKGICPQCGVDLNRGRCECVHP